MKPIKLNEAQQLIVDGFIGLTKELAGKGPLGGGFTATKSEVTEIPPEPKVDLEGLRALRLWHWQQYQAERRQMQAGTFHLKQVQLLNDFFPIGDTAEGDQ